MNVLYRSFYCTASKRERYVHRALAAEVLRRPLRDGEVVHHRNGNRRDNRLENLEVFDSQGAHARYHHVAREIEAGQTPLFDMDVLLEARGLRGTRLTAEARGALGSSVALRRKPAASTGVPRARKRRSRTTTGDRPAVRS